jgi:anthranilate synthase component II
MSILIIDNYDSFTYNLLQQCQHVLQHDGGTDTEATAITVARHDAITLDDIARQAPKLIVLSPGPGRPENAGITLATIEHFMGRIPLFGVCLGMQAMACHLGIPVTRTTPMHGKLSRIQILTPQHPLFQGLPEHMDVVRYHSLHLAWQPGSSGRPLATSDDGVIMAFDATPPSSEAFAWGVQFHPESIGDGSTLTHGQQLLRNVCLAAGLVREQHLV